MNYSEYRKLKKADPLSSPVSTSKKSKSAEETKPRMTYSEYRQQQKSITNPIALVQTKPAQPIMQDVTPVAPSKEFELKYSKYFVPDTKIGNPTSTSKINLPVNDVALNKDEQDWLNDKKKVSNAKAMEQSRIEAEQMAEQNPLLGSAVSVFGNAAGSAVAPIATLGTKLTGKEIDPNSPAYRLIQQANAARQGTKTGVKNALGVQDGTFAQKAVDFGVDTGLSMAETVVRSLFMSPIAGATQAGLSAASRRLVEAKQNGADDSRALASAVAQGVAEEFFEKFSLEGLRAFRTNPATGFKAVLKNIAKQSFTEGSEEFFTDWANAISDYFIMGGDSEWKQSYNNYLAQGMSEDEAIRRTFVDTLEQSALSFLGGAVSGGVLGGGVSVMNLGNNARVGSEMNLTEESLNDMAESVDTEKENYTNRNAYKTAVETQQMYQELARRVANGETLSNAEKGATLEAAMNLAAEASGNHVEKTEVSSLDSSIDAINRAENTFKRAENIFKRAESSENVQNVPSIGQRAASFPESVRDTYINGFNDNINSNDDIVTYDENMRKVYEAGLRGDPIASLSDDTSFMDFYNSSESAADSVDAMWIKGAEMRLQNSRSASTIDTNTEVNNNGRQTGTNLSDEGGIRPLSQRTREQSEGIRRATEEVRGIWKSTGSPADTGIRTQRFLQKVRAEQIIPIAKKGTYLYTPENKTKSMERAESYANDYGLKVVSWGGGVATSNSGKAFRGMTIPGTDTIYAQVDNNEFSQDKLVLHEIAENKLSKEEFASILEEASKKSEAVSMAVQIYQAFGGDEYENAAKELICDSNGLINQFKLLADSDPEYRKYAAVLEDALNVINPIVSSRLESKKQSFNKGSVAIETNAATERKLKAAGIAIDHETNSVFSYSTWNRSQYVEDPVTASKELAKALGISQKKARAFIDDISSIAKMIASDKDKLAYTESGLSPFVSNSEYGGSFDFDTSCTKRRVFAGTFTAIQNALPNTALTSEEVLQIRKMMDDAGFEVPCGKCYVEGSRASMGQFTKRFLELYKKYYPNNWQPNMAQANTPDGIEWIRLTHPECYQQYEYFWNHYGTLRPGDPNLFASQQKPKLYMAHSAYSDEILTEFKNSTNVIDKNRNGGIRFQIFSDFEIIHAIDAMQAIMDMSRVGLAGQAYTKQPNFVRAFGNTGMKINLSIDAWSVDENGNLTFNNKEGMPFETAMELRDKFSKNVGTICCVYDDKMLLAALADDRIDFIIPFHRSQWKKAQYKAMGLPHTTKDYTNQQNEKWLYPKDHTHKYRGRQVPTKCTNYMPNEYWDFSKSGKENAEIYLQKCFEDGKRPKFYKFLDRNSDGSFSLKKDGSTDGYWKLLIDFKMYDNNGVGSPQMPVRPNFEMDAINQMLTEYKGGHQNYPVAQGIVDEFVDSYKKSHAGAQFSSSIVDEKNLAPTFYSKMEREIENFKGDKLGAASIESYLKGKGVKDEEIKWSGIHTFLEGKKSVTKQDLLDYAKANRLQIEEKELGSAEKFVHDDSTDKNISLSEFEKNTEQYANEEGYTYSIESYDNKIHVTFFEDGEEIEWSDFPLSDSTHWGEFKIDGGHNYREYLFKMPRSNYSNSAMQTHWSGEKGVLAHARVQDLSTPDGHKVLFVEEIQSDWHNAGAKKGYTNKDIENLNELYEEMTEYSKIHFGSTATELLHRSESVGGLKIFGYSDSEIKEANEFLKEFKDLREELNEANDKASEAPFKNNYTDFVLKNLLRKAAEGGYDYLGWTTGKMQEKRWSSDYAEGYRIEYDQDIPKFLKKYGKQWGAKLSTITAGQSNDLKTAIINNLPDGAEYMSHSVTLTGVIANYEYNGGVKTKIISYEELMNDGYKIPAIDITDSMKQSVLYEGQPQFSSSITAGMTDEERYNILKDKTINIVESVPAKITNDYKEALSKANTSALARKLFVKLATDFGLKKEYSNSDINLKFNFSRNDVEESVTKQNKNNISDLMLLFTCLDDVVSNAIGIEVHNRNDIGYKKNEHLMAMYVLAGAFSDGDRIIPVKLEVKEFDTNPNSLYVAIALESIKKDDIFGSSTDETSASNPPSSTYKLADLFKNINASDRSFVKYIPIQFRTQENSSSLTAGLSSDEIRSRLDNIKELNSVGSMGYPHASEWQATRVGDNKEPMRLSDINKMIEQQLGINVTVGQIRKQGVRGNYNNVSHGIRTRVAMDLPTISHEVGHWFDYKYGKISQQKLTTEVQNELKAALGSLAGSYPARLHYVEGTAEFFRKYLTNSVEATNKYPNATKYFLGSLSPRDLAIVKSLADEVNAYYALGAENAQGAIRLREDGGMDFRTIREKMKDRWDGFYQKWVSSNQAIRNLDKATGGNAYIKATNAAYADAIAANIIEGNLTDIHGQYVGPGLGAALEGVNIKNKKEYMAFNEYLVCKHGPEWLADGKRVFADDRMNTTAFMNKRVAELDKQYPQFKAAQARLVQFIKDFNQTWGVNTGLVDQKLYDALNKKYPNYVPFYRALEKGGSRGAKSGFANQMNPYRRAKGSGLDIIAPVDNVFEQIATMVNAAIRNDVMLSVRNAAQNLGAEATFLEKVAAPMVPKQFDTAAIKNALSRDIDIELNKNGVNMDIIDDINAVIDSLQDTITQFNQGKATGNIVSVLVKGKKEFYKINDPMLLESLTHMTSAKRNGLLGSLATITRFMTANITGNNVIWGIFSNAPRDFETFAVYSKNKNPMKAFSGFAEAYKNSVKDFFDKEVSPLYSEYLAMGGGHSSVYANDRNLAKDARKALVDKSGGNRLTALAKRLANPINWASMLTDTIEMGPRFATYKMCREMGMNPETAFYEAMDVTVNFRRGGVYSKEIGKYVPFFNASVQGIDKFGRYFSAEDIANPKRRAKVAAQRFTTFVAVSALIGMIQWLINSRDDDDKKNYAQLSTYTKNSYIPIPLGDGKYFVVPKPRELGTFVSGFANAFEMYMNGNKHAFDDFYTYAADNFLPDVASQIAEFPFNVKHDGLSEALGDLSAGILGAPFFGPFVDIRMNRDFLGRPIISSSFSYKSVEPRDVFTDNTSKIAYWIGQGLNYEPVKIDYLGNNILGYLWKYPSALIGNVGGERDLSLGVKNSYIKDNQFSQDLTNWMYDQRERSERAFNSDEGSIDKKIVADLDDDMTSFYSNFNKLNKANTNQSQKRANKQLVMDMIAGYRAYKDGGTNPSLEAVKDVIRDYAESGTSVSDAAKLLPDVMEVTVKSQYKDSKNKTVKDEYSLTDKQYYDFQADYNAQYYSFIEQNLKMSDPLEKKVGVIEAAKEAAKNNATLNMLKKLGARTDAKMTDVETVRTKAQEKAAKAVFEEAYNSAKENDADGHFSSQEMYQLATDFAKKNSGYNAEELYLSKAGNAKKTYDKYTAAGGTWDDFDDYLEMQSLSGEDKQEKIMDYLQNSNWSESTRKKLWEIAYESEYGTKKAEYGY